MKRRTASLGVLLLFALGTAAPRWSQDKKDPPRARIGLYRVAPGKQLDFLKWLASRDEVAKEAGLPAVQLYAHLDGDSWDYLGVWPLTTPEQDKKMDEIATRRGLRIGFPAALEFRELLSSHTDTYVEGPLGAADLVALAGK